MLQALRKHASNGTSGLLKQDRQLYCLPCMSAVLAVNEVCSQPVQPSGHCAPWVMHQHVWPVLPSRLPRQALTRTAVNQQLQLL